MRFILFFTLLFGGMGQVFAIESRDDLKNQIIPTDLSEMTISSEEGAPSGFGLLDYIFAFVRDAIFDLLIVFAVGMFLYLGTRLFMARGNQEEFKKSLLGLVYAGVGIFAVAIAWVAVKFVTGLDV